MPLDLRNQRHPLLYLITSGETTGQTTPSTEDFSRILHLVRAAVAAGIDLIQIREKQLTARVLFELARSAAEIVRGSETKLLINDRGDIAAAAGAHGVHLTTSSLPSRVVRQTFGDEFLIGVSTHSLEEAQLARDSGADFAVFGPIFETPSKKYGAAKGIDELTNLTSALRSFPVLALGGITEDRIPDCIVAGASGVAAISMLQCADRLGELSKEIHNLTLKANH
jgi:thiamine-phosphate pyrophosphorylase